MSVVTNCALVKPSFGETLQVLLTSPMLHIGSKEGKINAFEFVATSQYVYYPDAEALARAFLERGKLQEYLDRIAQRQSLLSLLRSTFGEDWPSLTTKEGGKVFGPRNRVNRSSQEDMAELRPFIRDGFGHQYIPGSSIKGAIRTAIAYHLIRYNDRYQVTEKKSAIEQRIRQGMGDIKQRAKFFDDGIFMDNLFANFGFSYQESSIKVNENPNPNTDFMRAIKISDSSPLIQNTTKNQRGQTIPINLPIVTEVIVSSHYRDGKAKYRASIFVEMVRNIQAKFSISIDTEMLSWFKHRQGMQIPFKTVDDILNICNDFGQEQWDAEYDYWQDVKDNNNAKDNKGQNISLDFSEVRRFYENKECRFTLRLGWASGMNGTTIGLLLEDELQSQIRDNCGIKAPGFEAPKSRRTVTTNDREIRFVPSWVKLRFI